MMIRVDKFLIAELQERGFDIDYKKMKEIYTQSRNRPECIEHKERKMKEKLAEERFFEKLAEQGIKF